MPINSKELIIIKKSKEIGNVLKYIKGTIIIKNIYIKNKIVNFITKKMNMKYDKNGLPVREYYKEGNIPNKDKMRAVGNQNTIPEEQSFL